MIKPPASTPASTPGGSGKGKEFEGRLPTTPDGIGISKQPATQDNSVVSPVSPVRRGGRESIAPTVMSPVPADDPKPEPTPDPKPEPTASSNDNPVVDAGGPPQDPPTDGPSWSETPEPEEDPLDGLVRVARIPVDPERTREIEARLVRGVLGLQEKFSDFSDVTDLGEGATRTALNLELEGASRDILFHTVVETDSTGEIRTGMNIYFLGTGDQQGESVVAYSYFAAEYTSPDYNAHILRQHLGDSHYSGVPRDGEVSYQLRDEIVEDRSRVEDAHESVSIIRVGHPELDFVLSLAEREGVRPTSVSLGELDRIHFRRRGGLEPGEEESTRGGEEFVRYLNRYLGDDSVKSGEVEKEDGSILRYAVERLPDSAPTVKITYDDRSAEEPTRFTFTYQLSDGKLENTMITELVGSDGGYVPEDVFTVRGDMLEARRVRNFLANPQ